VASRLIDKSALLRLTFSSVAADWVDRIHRGLVWIRTVTRPEIGCSASSTSRSGADAAGARQQSVSQWLLDAPCMCEGGRWVPPLTAKDDAVRRNNTKSRSETSVEWLGIPELAQMLGVSEDFIRSQVQQRKIPYYKVGKLIRFDPREVTQWLSGLRVEPLF
jgi:excisionase family DNA binding protein